MRKIFGTDGVRGRANQGNLAPDKILRLAQAAGHQFLRGDHRHLVVIGKDTRLSGYMVEPALTAGFISMGMDVVLVGPMPTPAIAMLTSSLRADLGVMISASHNPHHDNGIKFFGPDGQKLPDGVELAIETKMATLEEKDFAEPDHLGRAKRLEDATGRYVEYVKSTFPKGLTLNGFKIVIDCAHGAAYKIAPLVLWELGADIVPIGVQPDGFNINLECGATSPFAMRQAVLDHQAHLGIALDGDADRLLLCDEKGNLIDGDQILALIASHWQKTGQLKTPKIVSTIMSNLGLERFLKDQGIELIRTQVGDRYVSQAMQDYGANIGGEPSGHVVLSDYTTTGDGLIAALQVLALLASCQKPASEICTLFIPVQQIHKNVRLGKNSALNDQLLHHPNFNLIIQKAMDAMTALGGRLVVRKSGTEPLLRIMAEGDSQKELQDILDMLVKDLQAISPFPFEIL